MTQRRHIHIFGKPCSCGVTHETRKSRFASARWKLRLVREVQREERKAKYG